MKKTLKFLQSMRFGMLLLVLILLCSLAGSLIAQGKDAAYYASVYGKSGGLLTALRLNDVFNSWYFILLIALLCISLLFCSALRLGRVVGRHHAFPELAKSAELIPAAISLEQQRAFCARYRFRPVRGQSAVYARARAGHFGSFAVHASLLMLLVAAALALYFSQSTDVTLRAGESIAMKDGSAVTLRAFSMKDSAGALDYESRVSIAMPDGSGREERVRVNHPVTVGGQKLFQMGYGEEGSLTISNGGQKETLPLTEDDVGSFFTLDGKNGVSFLGLLSDAHAEDPAPLYALYTADDTYKGKASARPGTTLNVGGVEYTFEPLTYTSTLRVKTYPPAAFELLYLSFVLLTCGLWLTFFHVPACVCFEEKGYRLLSSKPLPDLAQALDVLSKPRTGA